MNYSKEDLTAFDSYRGILSIVVMLGHLVQIFWLPLYGLGGTVHHIFSTMANYAVVGFFFLSGALICDSILKNFKRNGRFEWLEYLISRIARIYPSLFAAIILATIYYFIIGSHSLLIPGDKYVARELYSITFLDVQQALLMLEPGMFSVNGSLWSLFIEWRLYMWAMFLALFIDRKVCISDQSDHACRTKLTTDVGVN